MKPSNRPTPPYALCAVKSPWGDLFLIAQRGAIVALTWSARGKPDSDADQALLAEGTRQLQAYFNNAKAAFDLPLRPAGSPFQQRVYQAMQAIPTGQTRTYGELAAQLQTYGQPIGQACGANPIPIIIPCHRVLGAKGAGGFSARGGVETKMALLKHENAWPYLL